MYLYDKKENRFDIYSVVGKQDDLFAYRKQEMEHIPDERKVLIYKDRNSDWLISYETYPAFAEDGLKSTNLYRDEIDALLRSYYDGKYNSSVIQIISSGEELRYLLDTEGKYSRDRNDLRQVKNIIELPRTLYTLQMFIQERFTYLKDEDITPFIDLFGISKVDELSIPELQKVDKYGFTQDVYGKVSELADNHSKVLSLMKK